MDISDFYPGTAWAITAPSGAFKVKKTEILKHTYIHNAGVVYLTPRRF